MKTAIRTRGAATAGFVVFLVAACGAAPSEPGGAAPTSVAAASSVAGQPSASGDVLVRAEPPPPSPPTLRAGSVTLDALSYEWYAPAPHTTQAKYPAESLRADSLPRVPVQADPAQFALSSPAQPSRIEVKLFTSITDGAPTGERRVVLCTQRCGRVVDQRSLSVAVSIPTGTKVVVMMIFYDIPLDSADPQKSLPAFDYVSYGLQPVF